MQSDEDARVPTESARYAKMYPNSIPLSFEIFYQNPEYNDLRRLKLLMMSDKFNQLDTFRALNYDTQTKLLMEIENSCLNEAIRKSREEDMRRTWDDKNFVNLYHGVCYLFAMNLDNEVNANANKLMNLIVHGYFPIHNIASMSCKELCPEKYESILERIKRRNAAKHVIRTSSLYTCGRCKSKTTISEGKQTRSLDEPLTYFITCVNCGNNWTKGG
jgi:DNA-directed RNA polymerase subunit M/transcription elongation factor TFIIS